MNRRKFLASGTSAVLAAACGSGQSLAQGGIIEAGSAQANSSKASKLGNALNRHRIGVNYTPSHNWWFCWNEWDVNPIKRDLDAIAALGRTICASC